MNAFIHSFNRSIIHIELNDAAPRGNILMLSDRLPYGDIIDLFDDLADDW